MAQTQGLKSAAEIQRDLAARVEVFQVMVARALGVHQKVKLEAVAGPPQRGPAVAAAPRAPEAQAVMWVVA